jgi:hypothetical protein
MSRFDAISALEGLIEARGIRLRDVVVLVERLVIMHELVKKL